MRRAILLSVGCVGISSIVTQIVTLREFLNLFSGNELVIGIILGNWLLLTGLGSILGRRADRIRNPVQWLLACQVVLAFLPLLQVAGIRLLKALVLPGLMLGIGRVFLASLALLGPYCLVSGFLLPLFSGMISRGRDVGRIGDVYVLDTLGDVLGGLLFSLVLVFFCTPFETVAVLLALNLAAAAVLASSAASPGRRLGRGLPFAALLLLAGALLWRFDLEDVTVRAGFPGQELIEHRTTAYGSLVATRQGDQVNVYEDGRPVGSTHDPAAAEEAVHYALVEHPDPRVVLLVSGGLAGALREAAKYPLERMDYVELDPAVLDLARRFAGAGSDPRTRMLARDARRVVRAAHAEYDAVLVNLPDPATAQLNRFYTTEFFSEVHSAMRPGGVLSFGLSGAENYANEPARLLGSAVYRSLASVFENILVIPGPRMFLVASDRPLDYRIAARLRQRGISTRYVHQDYLRAKLTDDRIAAARDYLGRPTAPNRDFFPVSYYAHLRYWLSQFGSGLLLPSLLVAAILVLAGSLLAGSRRPVVGGALCASAFAGMGLEVVLLIAFQICYGYVYRQIGWIMTAFLVGAAAGAAWSNRRRLDPPVLIFRLDAALAAGALLLPPVMAALRGIESEPWVSWVPVLVFPLLNGLVGLGVGGQFPVAARLVFGPGGEGVERTAGILYAFDLLGASLGALLVSAFCVPLMGITGTCILIGALKVVSALVLRARRRALAQPLAAAGPARRLDAGALGAFGIVLLTFVGLGLVMASDRTNTGLYAFSFAPAYHWLLVLLLAWGILRAMEFDPFSGVGPGLQRLAGLLRARTGIGAFRWLSFAAFAPLAFYPVFRCYFSIPYLFCHVCPRKCVFGFLRPYLVPAVLLMNLEKRTWCYQACPIGTLYDCQARTGGRPRRLRWLPILAIAVLAFTAFSYFKLDHDLQSPAAVAHDWYTAFFKNRYSVSLTVIGVAVGMIALSYRFRRSFCGSLCPIGTFSDLMLKLERSLRRGRVFGG